MRKSIVLATTMLLAAAVPALAHHGWSGYDSSKMLTVSGRITAMSYQNPHGTIGLQAADKTWEIVLAPPSRMERRGLAENMIQPGTEASVEGYAHETNANELRAERITVAGTSYELR